MTKKDTNICKAIAAIMMLAHHLFYNVTDLDQWNIVYGGLIPNFDVMNTIGFLGKMCVSIFVFLTGYGTAKSYMHYNIQIEDPRIVVSYTAKRYWKLLSSFWFVFLFSVMLAPIMSKLPTAYEGTRLSDVYGEFSLTSIWYFLANAMGLHDILQSPTFNATWWYMSYALMLVVAMPFVFSICKRYGLWALVIEFFLFRYLNSQFVLIWYMLALFAGVLAAQKQFYEKLHQVFDGAPIGNKILLIVLGGGTLLTSVYLRWHITNANFWDILEAVNALALGVVVTLGLSRIPVLSSILEWVGKHSMNVFLTHSLIFYYWFRSHIYSMQYPLLILTVLLAESLLLSVLLEYLKKLLRWDRYMDMLYNKILSLKRNTQQI